MQLLLSPTRTKKSLDIAAEQLHAKPDSLYAFVADITSVESLSALYASVREAVGEIDILVQSAGITGAQGLFREISDEGCTSTILVDLIGPVRLVREFLPDLRTGGWGRLVLIASEDAVQPYDDRDLLGDDPIAAYDLLNDAATAAVRKGVDPEAIFRFQCGDFPSREGFAHLAMYRGFQAWLIAKHLSIPFHLSPETIAGMNEHVVPNAEEWRGLGVLPLAVEPPAGADDETLLFILMPAPALPLQADLRCYASHLSGGVAGPCRRPE